MNPLYAGRQVFNRHRFARDPDTGTRRARLKNVREWIETPVPELAIVDEESWPRVQDRLAAIPARRPEWHRRPKRLFSGLVVCGACGGQITIAWRDRYGCQAARQKGTCRNTRTMAAPLFEARVLDGLRERMLAPELASTFVEEYHSRAAASATSGAATAPRGGARTHAYLDPRRGRFDLELHGHLAAILNAGKHGNSGGGRGIRTLDTSR
ncbi:MAG: recombinase zinc beta ribbon domain-containing protein [Proteobacteria bacterium]|nr:recombinase zinc beta ribbon domain-containing protein [Pseudomonadota bacterium]